MLQETSQREKDNMVSSMVSLICVSRKKIQANNGFQGMGVWKAGIHERIQSFEL